MLSHMARSPLHLCAMMLRQCPQDVTPGLRGFARHPRGQAGKSRPHQVWALGGGRSCGHVLRGRAPGGTLGDCPCVGVHGPRLPPVPQDLPPAALVLSDPELVSGQLCSKVHLQPHTTRNPMMQAVGRLRASPCW